MITRFVLIAILIGTALSARAQSPPPAGAVLNHEEQILFIDEVKINEVRADGTVPVLVRWSARLPQTTAVRSFVIELEPVMDPEMDFNQGLRKTISKQVDAGVRHVVLSVPPLPAGATLRSVRAKVVARVAPETGGRLAEQLLSTEKLVEQ